MRLRQALSIFIKNTAETLDRGALADIIFEIYEID